MQNDDKTGRSTAIQQYEPTGEELRELQAYGYKDYDRERRVVILTAEGIMHFLSAFNDMKRKVKVLEEKVKTSIPMSHLADMAMNALKRSPYDEKVNFQRTEDMLSTWSAANGNAGSDVLEKMDNCYEQTMEKQQEKEERSWLIKNGQQTNYFAPIGQQIKNVENINHSNRGDDGR